MQMSYIKALFISFLSFVIKNFKILFCFTCQNLTATESHKVSFDIMLVLSLSHTSFLHMGMYKSPSHFDLRNFLMGLSSHQTNGCKLSPAHYLSWASTIVNVHFNFQVTSTFSLHFFTVCISTLFISLAATGFSLLPLTSQLANSINVVERELNLV